MTFSVIEMEIGILRLIDEGEPIEILNTSIYPERKVGADMVPHLCTLPDGTMIAAHNAPAVTRSAAYLLKYFLRDFNSAINAKPFMSSLIENEPTLKPRNPSGGRF